MIPAREQTPTKSEDERWQAAAELDVRAVLTGLCVSAVLIAWISLANGSFSIGVAIFLFALPWILLRAGGVITTLLRFPSFFAFDFALGAIVVSVGIMAWKILVPVSLWILLIGLVAVVAVVPRLLRHHERAQMSSLEILAVLIALAAATGWSQDLLSPTRAVDDVVIFKPWSDFFFHATILARSLSSQNLLEVGNYEWKGLPAIDYHYASYSLAIFVAKVGTVSTYAAAVGFWAPFGSFLAGLAAYCLSRLYWSEGAGLASLAGVALIPDCYLLNLAHPFYGYFWLQHVDPGGLYGVAVAGIALAVAVRGIKSERRSWIGAGVILAILVALFKVQIFAAAFPLIFSVAVLGWPARRISRWLFLGLCVVTSVSALQIASHLRIGPGIYLNFSGGAWYWNVLANMAKGTPLESWYSLFSVSHPFPSHLALAFGLLLISALGVFVFAAPILWLRALVRRDWTASEGISLTAVGILLLMTFGLSGNSTLGLPEELIHRPFVWAYWVVGAFTAGRVCSLLAARLSTPPFWGIALAFCILALIPAYYGRGLQQGKWPGASAHRDIRVDRGLVESARYIRNQPPSNALVQDSDLEDWFPILDGLSERGSFAGRPAFWARISAGFRNSNYRRQLALLKDLQSANSVSSLKQAVRETGIRWYLVRPGDSYSWPNSFREHPVFESHGYKVYDMQRCFALPG